MSLRATRQYVEILAAGGAGGVARVTRQYVEILAAGAGGVARVTRQYVEILSIPMTVSAADVLSLSDDTVLIYEVSATDSVALSDQAIGEYVRTVIDTLVLTDEAVGDVELVRYEVDSLSLTDGAIFDAVWRRGTGDTLTLQDEALVAVVFITEAFDWLVLTDAASRVVSASDVLVLSEQVDVDQILGVTDALVLSDASSSFTVRPRAASDALIFTEIVIPGFTTERAATDALSLSETAIGDYCKVATDSLVLSDDADFEFVRLIADTLVLSDDATVIGVFGREAHDFLTFGDAANLDREIDGSAIDALSLIEQAGAVFEAVDTLSLSDAAEAVSSLVAYDTLILVESAEFTRDRASALDTLILVDIASYNITRYVSTRDHLALDEYAWPGFHRVIATDALQTSYTDFDPETLETFLVYEGLLDTAKVSVVYFAPKEAGDHLSFGERAVAIKILAAAIAATASDSLVLTDEARTNITASVADSFFPADTAEAVVAKLLEDELSLLDTASFNINRNSLAVSDSLELSESVLWYNQLEDYLCVYHPFAGTGPSSAPTPPPLELEGPISGITVPFQLVYPVTGPFSDTLSLRAPNLGNRDKLQMNRISRETRGGTLIVFADPMWPKIQTLALDFSGLTETEASGLHTFMDDHLGQEIGILDWEHRFWKGVITDLAKPIVQDGRGCKYSVGFEFEGEMATYDPGP